MVVLRLLLFRCIVFMSWGCELVLGGSLGFVVLISFSVGGGAINLALRRG